MPTYYAAGVNIRLSTVPPTDSLSPKILKGPDNGVKKETKRVQAAIAASWTSKLTERSMNLNPDTDSDNDIHLHFLGSARTVPFYCMGIMNPFSDSRETDPNYLSRPLSPMAMDLDKKQTSVNPISIRRESFVSQMDTSSSGLSTLGSTPLCSPNQSVSMDFSPNAGKPSMSSGPRKSSLSLKLKRLQSLDPRMMQTHSPKPLVLTVNLNNLLSYSRSLDKLQKSSDIRIDVFFNGLLTHSSFLSHKQKDEKNAKNETTSSFSGMRIERLVEAAWLIFPPTDASVQSPENEPLATAGNSAQQRWEHIATAIRGEANSLGLDQKHSRPPLGEYLYSLSTLPMPPAVTDLVVPNGRAYGVLDVAITLGHGKKFPTSHGFLKAPEMLNDHRYNLDCSLIDPGPTPPEKPHEEPGKTTGEDQNRTNGKKQKMCTLASTRSKRLSAPSRLSSVLSADSAKVPEKPQLQLFSNFTPGIFNSNKRAQDTPTPATNEVGISWTKRRKLRQGWGFASRLSAYSPLQRLARRPIRVTDPALLGPPRIFFPDHDLAYFNSEVQSRQTNRVTATAGATRKNKKGKKSRILTFRGPKISSMLRTLANAQNGTTDKRTRDYLDLTSDAAQASGNVLVQTSAQAENETKPSMKHSKVKKSLTSGLDGPHWSSPLSDASPAPLCPALPENRNFSLPTTGPDDPFISTPLHQANSNAATPHNKPIKLENAGQDSNDIQDRARAAPFPIPELSQNCVLSYMSPSELLPLSDKQKAAQAASEKGAVRHRRAERAGEFFEDEVLLGCRYVVGG